MAVNEELKKMAVNEERRSEPRYGYDQEVSLTIMFASQSPHLLGKRLNGSTVDVSGSGIKLQLNTRLPVDSTIDVSVALKGKKYFLSGKVRWCEQGSEPGMFHVGIALQDLINTSTDYKAWKVALKDWR